MPCLQRTGQQSLISTYVSASSIQVLTTTHILKVFKVTRSVVDAAVKLGQGATVSLLYRAMESMQLLSLSVGWRLQPRRMLMKPSTRLAIRFPLALP